MVCNAVPRLRETLMSVHLLPEENFTGPEQPLTCEPLKFTGSTLPGAHA